LCLGCGESPEVTVTAPSPSGTPAGARRAEFERQTAEQAGTSQITVIQGTRDGQDSNQRAGGGGGGGSGESDVPEPQRVAEELVRFDQEDAQRLAEDVAAEARDGSSVCAQLLS